jgi:biopolymer transport protein ExbD
MFFMLTANFVMEQVNEAIKLPRAISAKALDTSVDNYLILNVDAQGVTTIGKGEVYASPVTLEGEMRRKIQLDKERAKPADWEKGKGRSLIILRAHRDCNYKQVHDVMAACRRAGYADIQLRAIQAAPGKS